MEEALTYFTVVLFALALSFLFSGMEAGVFALSRLRIRHLMRSGRRSAEVLHNFLENPESFFWTILVGNTLANFVAVSLLVTRLYDWLGHDWRLFALGLLAMIVLLYVLFELFPKTLFRQFPNRLCLFLARPFQWVNFILSPAVSVLARLSRLLLRWTGGKTFTGRLFGTRDELRQVMQESGQEFTSEEQAMINRVLDLQNVTVRQISRPLHQTVTVEATAPVSEVLQLCREHHHTRLPVWQGEGERRRIAGVISVDTLLYSPDLEATKPAGEFLRPAVYLDENLRLELAIQRMQRSGQRLAIVLGADRKEQGIISLHDLMKFIFGEVTL